VKRRNKTQPRRPARKPANAKRRAGRGPRRHREVAIGIVAILLLLASAGAVHFWYAAQHIKKPAPTVAAIPPAYKPAPPAAVAPATTSPPSVTPEASPKTAALPPSTTVLPPAAAPLAAITPPRAAAPPWLRNATPAPPVGAAPRIAIVIDDCGLDRPRTERAIELPAAVTLSFLPYANDLPAQTEAARRRGHELLVHVPMEPINARLDMGPNGLAVDLPREEVLRRLRWDLGRFDGYVGINNHMGSRFTTDRQAMSWVIGELRSRGLMFLDSRTIAGSVGESLASADDVPYAGRDVFLDDDRTADAVEARLMDAEAVARKKGAAIAIGHPHDATLLALNRWIAELPRSGIVLVPLTAVVHVPAAPE